MIKKYIKKALLIIGAISIATLINVAFATTPELPTSDYTAYRMIKNISNIDILVPTVVEVPFPEYFERSQFVVVRNNNGAEQFSYLNSTISEEEIQVAVLATNIDSLNGGTSDSMLDKNENTYASFGFADSELGDSTTITLETDRVITSSSITILLDRHISYPTSIEIRAGEGSKSRILIAKRSMGSQTIKFPETTSDKWFITLEYSQPLRITEIELENSKARLTTNRGLRFLAQPNETYKIYFDPDRNEQFGRRRGDSNLADDTDVEKIANTTPVTNPLYKLADSDSDGIPNLNDNCVTEPNPNQEDINQNNRGDACDDFDKDGLINSKDNCPNEPNRNQRDTDSDGIGDVCDGAESRFTEKYKWVPWTGMGIAALVLIFLFIKTARLKKPEEDNIAPPTEGGQ